MEDLRIFGPANLFRYTNTHKNGAFKWQTKKIYTDSQKTCRISSIMWQYEQCWYWFCLLSFLIESASNEYVHSEFFSRKTNKKITEHWIFGFDKLEADFWLRNFEDVWKSLAISQLDMDNASNRMSVCLYNTIARSTQRQAILSSTLNRHYDKCQIRFETKKKEECIVTECVKQLNMQKNSLKIWISLFWIFLGILNFDCKNCWLFNKRKWVNFERV